MDLILISSPESFLVGFYFCLFCAGAAWPHILLFYFSFSAGVSVCLFVCLVLFCLSFFFFFVYLWPHVFTFGIGIYPWKRDNETTKKKRFYALDRWSALLFGFMKTSLLSFWPFEHLFVTWGCKLTSGGTLPGLRVLSIQKVWRKIMPLTATIMIMTMITMIIIIMNMTTDMVTLNIFSVSRQKMFVLACHPVLSSWFQPCCFVAIVIYI